MQGLRHGCVSCVVIVFALPGERLRLRAALGPLQEMGLVEALSLTMKPAGGGTVLVAAYRISGDSLHGLDKLAPVVDGVFNEQITRLKRFLETGRPERRRLAASRLGGRRGGRAASSSRAASGSR